jgi:hypothetical protein
MTSTGGTGPGACPMLAIKTRGGDVDALPVGEIA